MSSDNPIKDRIDRSCHLSLKQYNIILSYLNTGIKPSIRTLADSDLVGKLNGGVNKCGRYHRLKSIASRLMLRPTDGALLFASNRKIVIPSSKFVQAIKQAHRGTGDKHLNCSQTLAKLQETYTIGRRQFGICEDQIRDVVKSCNQGSCRSARNHKRSSNNGTPAKKARLDSEDKSHEQSKEKGSQLLKSLLAINVYQSPSEVTQTTYIPNLAPNLSQTLNKSAVSLGNVQPSVNAPNCILVINPTLTVPSSSLTDLKSFTTPPKSSSNSTSLINPLTASQTSYVYILPTTTPAHENPLQVPSATSSNQTKFGTNLFSVQNSSSALTIPHSSVKFMRNPVFSIPVSSTSSKETNVNILLDVNSVINSFSSSVEDTGNLKQLDCSGATLLEASDDLDLTRYTDHDLSSHPDPSLSDDDDELSPSESRDNQVEIDNESDTVKEIVPFPHIWHYYQDLSCEKNPYQKINIGIQDMKLDLMRSLVGDNIAAERLKKKINYLDHLVKIQKTVTEPYKLDLL